MEKRRITFSEYESAEKLDSFICDALLSKAIDSSVRISYKYEDVIVCDLCGDEFEASILISISPL